VVVVVLVVVLVAVVVVEKEYVCGFLLPEWGQNQRYIAFRIHVIINYEHT
jgi:hypothetical protein